MSAIVLPDSPKLIVPSIFVPDVAIEDLFGTMSTEAVKLTKRLLKLDWKDRVRLMSGSQANYLTTSISNLVWGKTAYAGETTYHVGLWTAALDDTLLGNVANEATYTSYARLALTNNTTIFAAGSGTTTRTNQWPSDATKFFVTSAGGSSTITYMGVLNGNAGTSADKGIVWASVTSQAIGLGDTPQLAQNAVTYVGD